MSLLTQGEEHKREKAAMSVRIAVKIQEERHILTVAILKCRRTERNGRHIITVSMVVHSTHVKVI